MKISYHWLKNYIDTDLSIDEIAAVLTNIGLEIEGVEKVGGAKEYLQNVIVGHVLSTEKHPNADKLKITQIDFGNGEPLQIVCGAPNVAAGQKVAVARIGAVLPTPDGESFKIKKAKIRGEESNGMICSEVELGIGEDHSGILVLPEEYTPGTPMSDYTTSHEDHLLEIGLTPNRADAMSHYGVARDLFAALKIRGKQAHLKPRTTHYPTESKGKNPFEIEVVDSKLAPRYAGVYLENIKVKPSPEWLQNDLRTIGLSPINNVVDITNYILHDLGQPLHAFDAAKIAGKKVIVKTLPEGTSFKTLDGVERKLKGHELMICDAEKPMCMAGVFGGADAGITEQTTEIFLESAYFDPVTIRKGAKAHGLNTDASFRFERGIDPTITVEGLQKAVELLVKYADAEIASDITDLYPNPIQDFKVSLRLTKVKQILGVEIAHETIKDILKVLDIEIEHETEEKLDLIVPSYRVDVQREIDLIEEILRIYGYDNIEIPNKVSFSIIKTEGINKEKVEDFVARQLNAFGFHEAMNNSMIKREYEKIFEFPEGEFVEMLNPLSADLAVMRRSLITGLLENVVFNLNRRHHDIKLFEFGKVYTKTASAYTETRQLGIILSGNTTTESWTQHNRKTSFFDLKGIVNQIFSRLHLRINKEVPTQDQNLSDGIELFAGDVALGYMGVVDKKLAKKLDINQEVYYAQLNWDTVLDLASKQQLKYKEISKFPSSRRDLALLLDENVKYEDLYKKAFGTKNDLLKAVNLFDVYEGDKLPAGKKSYALSFILQDENKTLNDQEIDAFMKNLIKMYEKDFGATLR
ncbi:phenylalanine--tRNA ligase subunit beta [Vaginella massiliensis]|uniref:phenylalanine--tRNA ligase subunit beta n=1 Tax=Vaginella massiliensis TaxID=1816680 RepID=UPI003750C47C